jgi:hypothetical protein
MCGRYAGMKRRILEYIEYEGTHSRTDFDFRVVPLGSRILDPTKKTIVYRSRKSRVKMVFA